MPTYPTPEPVTLVVRIPTGPDRDHHGGHEGDDGRRPAR